MPRTVGYPRQAGLTAAGRYDFPLIVLDGFTAANKDKQKLMETLAKWALYVSEMKIARVSTRTVPATVLRRWRPRVRQWS